MLDKTTMNLLIKNYTYFFFHLSILGQDKYTISGTIYDKSSNETLIGATIYFPNLNVGTISNEYGFYSVTITKGTHEISLSYLGYKTKNESIILTDRISKDFYLLESSESLDEIIVQNNIEKVNIRTAQMSINKLSSKL